MRCLLDDLRAFDINVKTSGRLQSRKRGNGARRQNKARGETFHGEMDHCSAEKVRAGLRHAVVCPNMAGSTKERIAQSKRAHAGSLAVVD